MHVNDARHAEHKTRAWWKALSWINLLNSDLLMDTNRMGLYNIVMFKTFSFAQVFSGKCVDWGKGCLHQLRSLPCYFTHTNTTPCDLHHPTIFVCVTYNHTTQLTNPVAPQTTPN